MWTGLIQSAEDLKSKVWGFLKTKDFCLQSETEILPEFPAFKLKAASILR